MDGSSRGSLRQRSFSTGDLTASLKAGEQQTKIVDTKIGQVESHYPQLVHDLNLYVVRTAKMRDAGDILQKKLNSYSENESPGIKQGLGSFSECFAAVQDHRNTLVRRLEQKVLEQFTVYETRCKQARYDLRQHSVAHNKELNEHKVLERLKHRSPNERFKVAKAETKFKKAADDANRSTQILNDQISAFERQKVQDLKRIFGDFMLSEMMFYSKALEIYTRGYQELMNIDEDQNVSHLQSTLRWEPHQFNMEQSGHQYGGSVPALNAGYAGYPGS